MVTNQTTVKLRDRLRLRAMPAGAKKVIGLVTVALMVTFGWMTGRVIRAPVEQVLPAAVVNDVTRINPITVSEIIAPVTTEEIVAAVSGHPGPVSVGGGRYSMGGQTATENALHIDMRGFNQVVDFSPADRLITVQAGIRWRQIQEHIDPFDLSVKIMQTYADFTVGGSVSVNVHGRYIGLGPLVLSIRSLQVVLADGSLVEASPAENSDVFYGVVGGYGGLGVITEVTLELAENIRVKRTDRSMPITDYQQYFVNEVRDSPTVVFHNADIYPNAYRTVHAFSYSNTDEPVTVEDRLIPADKSYRMNRFLYWVISEWPFGKMIRQRIVEPIVYAGEPVTWRNYEASYSVADLEPASRDNSTYVLHEYFVPVERFDDFVPLIREVLQRNDVNVVNISIRHALPDPGTLLAWARSEVFAFVLYYKQDTDAEARAHVAAWTRELIDAVLSVDGTYYLPYQIHATREQFLRAYPRAPEFFALKARLDPTNKFRNKLWDAYYRPPTGDGATEAASDSVPGGAGAGRE